MSNKSRPLGAHHQFPCTHTHQIRALLLVTLTFFFTKLLHCPCPCPPHFSFDLLRISPAGGLPFTRAGDLSWPQRGYRPQLILKIYVYDENEVVGLKALMYGRDGRITTKDCLKGQWGTEVKIHKLLLRSRFRTRKKEEADLFFVPAYVKCVRMMGGLNDKEINETYVKLEKHLKKLSVIAEISSGQETTMMLGNVYFTKQLVLFSPQAISVHSHVQTLIPTLYSKQASIVDEQIEDDLFHMLDEETDSEIGDLVHTTIMWLLYASCPCPSNWMSICRNVVLATSTRRESEGKNDVGNDTSNGTEGDTSSNFGFDDETMVSSSRGVPMHEHRIEASHMLFNRDKHLRYRTRVFAAKCLSHLPRAVAMNPAHFDLYLARKRPKNGRASGDWLVLHVQELISLAYQISTMQFENIQPIGVGLLSTIVDKFQRIADPELPGHLLLEQYQAQLLSTVCTTLDSSSGPIMLEAGLHLATTVPNTDKWDN